ncbi:MAG TPA: cytochrome c [Pseudolabrys sp.]|nr:cytochrome c [Pseudolabrys sp.]
MLMRCLVLIACCAVLIGCTRSNMDSQPKYNEYKPGELFRDGRSMQQAVRGTVARGDLARANEITSRPALTPELLARGRDRFNVFCSPCHDRAGSGNGMIVHRGMPRPPSFHDDRLRTADDQHFFDVITHGHGAMYSYADRVRPRDRWAIVGYIRALQLSQHATLSDLPPEIRDRMQGEALQ